MKGETILTLLMIVSCEGANILVMLPLPLYSHTAAYMPVIKQLAVRGHKVTMVSPYPPKETISNLKHISVPEVYKEITDPEMFVVKEKNVMDDLKTFWNFGLKGSEAAFNLEAVQKIILSPSNSFDLIMTETFFLLEPMVALGYKFRCPIVNLHPWTLTLPVAHFTGNSLSSSYQPSVYTTYTDNMSFLQRVRNSLVNGLELAGLHWHYLPKQDAIMRKHLGHLQGFENLPYLSDMLRNTSLTLLDTHDVLEYHKPLFKNVIHIGGLTVQDKQTVPKDLGKFMTESKDGFIYFSLGSHLSTDMLPDNFQANQLFKIFKTLKQKIIMKWNNLDEPDKPNNVWIDKWFPQREILSHPNCKLFITHGGLHALLEAVYNAVPIVGLPLVADQPFNMKLVETTGMGISVKVINTTTDLFLDAINTILSDNKYKLAALKRSSIFKDSSVNTLDNAVYHIEYILRHQGANHLKPPSLQRSWYELLLLDVMLLLIAAVSLSLISLMALIRFLILICSTSKKKKEKKH